jgi:CheY-like chemotaxis protein
VYQQRSTVIVYMLVLYIFILLIHAVVQQREMKISNQLKLKFLRQMSHDIRTPINGIQGMVRIGRAYPEDLEKQKECREKVWDASCFLMDIVNDVLIMGKLESGEMDLEEKPFQLRELMERICYDMGIMAENYGVSLVLEKCEGTNWNLIGSPVYVRRVLMNIISNAIKYNQKNGTVTISCTESLKNTSPGYTSYEFVCEDTGIGMSHEFQKHMFDQFAQENVEGEVKHHGTGLGLAIVKSLVQKMQGTISCRSERGDGTIFTIVLPFAIDINGESKKTIEEEENQDENLKDISVLLVEDNEMNMEIAEFLLTQEGAVIEKAWNGQEAVELFEKSKPGEFQVILMDMMMPVMNGEKAARTIRSLEREDAKTIPIIAMTANAFQEDVQAALKAGMNAHLPKPINVSQLKKTIRKYCPAQPDC